MIILSTFHKPEGSLNVLWIENTETFHHHLQALEITHTQSDIILTRRRRKNLVKKRRRDFRLISGMNITVIVSLGLDYIKSLRKLQVYHQLLLLDLVKKDAISTAVVARV